MKYSSESIYKVFLIIFDVLLFTTIVLVAVESNKSPVKMAKENSHPKSVSVEVKGEGKAKGKEEGLGAPRWAAQIVDVQLQILGPFELVDYLAQQIGF